MVKSLPRSSKKSNLFRSFKTENISLDGQKKRIQLDQQNVCLVKQPTLEKSSQPLSNGHAFGLKEDYVSQTIIQETFRQPLAPIDAANDENKLNQAKQTTSATASATNVKNCGEFFAFAINRVCEVCTIFTTILIAFDSP